MVRDLRELVELESPSEDRELVNAAMEWVAAALRSRCGAQVEVLPGSPYGDHVRAHWGGEREPQLLVLCHADTVWPRGTVVKRPFRVEGERAYGPGVYDMKAGIVQLVWALHVLTRLGRVPDRAVTVLCTGDEEVGSPTSRPFIEAEARRSGAALVLEPATVTGAVKTWRKGVGRFRLEAHGRAAHAGVDPERGVSAVEELAHQILRLRALADPGTGTTVNVGVVGGGSKPNVVPEDAWAEVDVRVLTVADAMRVESALRGLRPVLAGASLRVSGGFDRPPMERTERVVRLFLHARALASELGFALEESGSGGASDGNLVAAVGVPVLDGLGAVGDGAHADHEHVLVGSLPGRTALVARLIETL
jgi:glutamate carboxypeptidase